MMKPFIFSISLTLFQVSCGVPLSSIKQQVLDEPVDEQVIDEQGYSKWCVDDENENYIDCPPYEVGRNIRDLVDDGLMEDKVFWTLYNNNCPKDDHYDLDDVLDENEPTGDCAFKNVYTRFFSHGFQPFGTALWFDCHPSVRTRCEGFVDAYSATGGDDWQFVCIDWCELADMGLGHIFDGGLYDTNAMRSIDVGEWLGNKLIALAVANDLDGTHFQLIGHSLGAHLTGTMSRTFNEGSDGPNITKLTGLDPAGPVFVQNGWGLRHHMIKSSDASFVQIIHTNGGLNPHAASINIRLGDLHQLGDVDIYVNGGILQPCGTSKCSHMAAIDFYIDSIDPPRFHIPMAHQCESVTECTYPNQNLWGDATIAMGEWAIPENDGHLYHQNLGCRGSFESCVLGTPLSGCRYCCQHDWSWTWRGSQRCNIDEDGASRRREGRNRGEK